MLHRIEKACQIFSQLSSRATPFYPGRAAVRTVFGYCNELAHILDKCPKIVSAEEAVCDIKSGEMIYCSGAATTPIVLIQAMVEHVKKNCLKDMVVCHMHTEGAAEYTLPENAEHFRTASFFMAGNIRKAVAEGRAENISIFLQDIPKVFYRKIYQPDVALIHVSMPDEHGFCSLGCSVDCVRAGVMHSKRIVAQMNKRMPRTFGDSIIHWSHFDKAIEIDCPLPQHGADAKSNEQEMVIAKLIAENLVKDGATLQTGIGNIPDSVLSLLHNHKNLGIHTELMSNGAVDLILKGAVSNSMKKIHTGRSVVSFLLGTDKLYSFVNNNPSIEMLRVDYVNSLDIIKQQPHMVAINACVEIDLTGQICSDSVGQRFLSGFGGQVDFIRGAFEAYDGKGVSIITLQSAAKNGESKIVPMLKPGAGVVTTRAHVNYVVTEYGIADLFGKTMPQRAYELIQIAHPDQREALEKAACERLKIKPYKKE